MQASGPETASSSADPLPAPTTVSSRSLRPRHGRGRSRTSSRSATTSRSNSLSRSSVASETMEIEATVAEPENTPATVKREGVQLHDVSSRSSSNGATDALGSSVEGMVGRKRRKPEEQDWQDASRAGPSNASETGPSTLPPKRAKVDGNVGVVEMVLLDAELREGLETRRGIPGEAVQEHTGEDLLDVDMLVPPEPQDAAVAGHPGSEISMIRDTLETPAPAPAAISAPAFRSLDGPIDVDAITEEHPTFRLLSPPLAACPPRPCSAPIHTDTPLPTASRAAPTTDFPPNPPSSGIEPLSAYTCPICYSPPTFATLTPCGHICCGECLFTAVKTTLQRAQYSGLVHERLVARCPVCRAPIPGWDGKGAGVIGLKPRAVFSL